MFEAHRGLGEVLVVVYFAIAIASFVLARRKGLPAWLTGTAHALLGVQIIMGIILYARNTALVPWTHVLFGVLALAALGLAVPLRPRIGRSPAIAVTALTTGVFAAVAMAIAMAR